MTVFGGTMVLSAIFAQSLMIANLPCSENERAGTVTRISTDNNAIFSDFDVVANGCSFYDRIVPYMNMVSYLHRVVIEISTISFVRRPKSYIVWLANIEGLDKDEPHDATFPD
jgi:hypothetical protein